MAIVAAIAPQIEAVERTLAMRRRPENLSAYEISLRARAHALEALGKGDCELIEQAIVEAEQALEIDPPIQRSGAAVLSHGSWPDVATSDGDGRDLAPRDTGSHAGDRTRSYSWL